MRLIQLALVTFVMTNFNFASASGMQVCHKYVSSDGQTFSLADAYRDSGLVAIGKVTLGEKTKLKITKKVKGDESASEIELQQPACRGTACAGGFSVAPSVELLFFLKKQPNGAYNSVTADGNFSCPVVFEVENGFAKFRDKKIAVDSLESYLSKKSSTLPLQ